MPKYTVVMPAKNAESTIHNAIRSVLASFPNDTQVAVWDDGSDDRTAEVALRSNPNRVIVMQSETSVGGGVARQKIIDATDSEFIVNQDSDDVSLPWRYALQSKHMKRADFSFTAMQRFSKRLRLHQPTLPLSYTSSDVARALIFHNPLSHPTMLARRSALSDIGGYNDVWAAQDYEMILRAAFHGKSIWRSGIPTLMYRLSTTQISQQSDYAARILGSTTILSSYGNLLNSLLPNECYNFCTPARLDDMKSKIDSGRVAELINGFSIHLRPYYRNLYSSKKLGHVSAEIL